MLNQRVLAKGNAGPGIPAVETLILNARDSVNVFGSVTLDATQGKGVPVVGRAGHLRLWRRPTPRRSARANWCGPACRARPSISRASTIRRYRERPSDRLGDGRLRLAAERIVFGYGPDTQP